MDRITKERRSWNMSRIHSKGTKPELVVRRYLYSRGVRYRLHAKLPGKPDVVICRYKAVIFVNGCFWHVHAGCKNASIPKSNTAFWQNKLNGNVERDGNNRLRLEEAGWNVLTVWECEVDKDLDNTMVSLMDCIGLNH